MMALHVSAQRPVSESIPERSHTPNTSRGFARSLGIGLVTALALGGLPLGLYQWQTPSPAQPSSASMLENASPDANSEMAQPSEDDQIDDIADTRADLTEPPTPAERMDTPESVPTMPSPDKPTMKRGIPHRTSTKPPVRTVSAQTHRSITPNFAATLHHNNPSVPPDAILLLKEEIP